MKIVKPSVTLLWVTPNAEQVIEASGRTAYKSEDKTVEPVASLDPAPPDIGSQETTP